MKKGGIPVYFSNHLCGRAVSMDRLERGGEQGYLFAAMFDVNGEAPPAFNYGSDKVLRDVSVTCDTVKSDGGLFPLRLYVNNIE
jgi:hypothetical protein